MLIHTLQQLGFGSIDLPPSESGFRSLTLPDDESIVANYAEFWGLSTGNDVATRAVVEQHVNTRCCMVPDIPSNRAIAQANIPPACRGRYGLYIDWQGFRADVVGFSQDRAREVFDAALELWNQTIDVQLFVSNDFASAKTNVEWKQLTGNVLAYSSLANNSCADDKQQRYDLRRFDEHQFYQTVLHEVGHLLGLTHRNGPYLMNPFIITDIDGITGQDVRDARSLGYGEPRTPTPDPQPPEPEPDLEALANLVASKLKQDEHFVESVTGPRGPVGQPGKVGPQGMTGPAGPQGPAGGGQASIPRELVDAVALLRQYSHLYDGTFQWRAFALNAQEPIAKIEAALRSLPTR